VSWQEKYETKTGNDPNVYGYIVSGSGVVSTDLNEIIGHTLEFAEWSGKELTSKSLALKEAEIEIERLQEGTGCAKMLNNELCERILELEGDGWIDVRCFPIFEMGEEVIFSNGKINYRGRWDTEEHHKSPMGDYPTHVKSIRNMPLPSKPTEE